MADIQKKTYGQVIDTAIEMYKSGEWAYLYGAKGQLLTDETMESLKAQEPGYFSRYNNEQWRQIKKNSFMKYGLDCSYFTGRCTGDIQWSKGQIANCYKYNTLAGGPPASLLFTTWGGAGRHIGLDIGGNGDGKGYCLQAGWEATDEKVREGRAGIFLSPIGETAWEQSGQSNFVDYTGAVSPYGPAKAFIDDVLGNHEFIAQDWVGETYGAALVPVYAEPDISGPRCTWPTLATGNLFDVCGETGGFYYIRIAGKHYGYIQKQYVLRKTPYMKGTVKTSLYVRQNAGTGFKKIGILYPGAKVDICDIKKAANGADWYYIIFNGGWGFCSAKYVMV